MLKFLKANARWVVGGFLLTMFSSFGQTFFIGLSGEELRDKFDLTDGQFGLIYMLATLASALTLTRLGRVLDYMPGWKVARFVIPALACACLLIAFAPHIFVLIIALYMLRLFGQGMMTHTALTEIGRWFAASRGRATSLTVLGHQAGEAILPITFALIAEKRGLSDELRGSKSFLYSTGLAEATETIAVFCLFCFVPAHFSIIAWVFSVIVVVTTISRFVLAYQNFRK